MQLHNLSLFVLTGNFCRTNLLLLPNTAACYNLTTKLSQTRSHNMYWKSSNAFLVQQWLHKRASLCYTHFASLCNISQFGRSGIKQSVQGECPTFDSLQGRYFPHQSSLTLGPTQAPLQQLLILFQRVKRQGHVFGHPPRFSAAIQERVLPPMVFMVCHRKNIAIQIFVYGNY